MDSTNLSRGTRLAVGLSALSLLVACAPSLATLEFDPKMTLNPAVGPAVRIGPISDQRVLVKSPSGDERGLLGADRDHHAPHALGRCPITICGAAKPTDFVLRRTVAEVVSVALANGFRDAGYRVVADHFVATEEEVVPVSAEVLDLWILIVQESMVLRYDFTARIRVTGDIAPFAGGKVVVAGVSRKSGLARRWMSRAWKNSLQSGLDQISIEITSLLAE